jgi:primosomal protein N'
MLIGLPKKIAQPLRCPDCDVDMDFLQAQYTSRAFASTLLERTFFRCPNCQRLDHRLVAIPLHFIERTTFHREHSPSTDVR